MRHTMVILPLTNTERGAYGDENVQLYGSGSNRRCRFGNLAPCRKGRAIASYEARTQLGSSGNGIAEVAQ